MELGVGLFLGLVIGSLVGWIRARQSQGDSVAHKARLESQVQSYETELQRERSRSHELQTKVEDLLGSQAGLEEKNHALLEQMSKLNEQMTLQFENLANRIFENKSQKFTDQNLQGLKVLLDPLREKLKDFERKVEDTYSTERAERGAMRGELQTLLELNKQMSQEAHNLTLALKGDVKTQGNWGEVILESILERSGLRRDEEYTLQGTERDLRGDEGQILRPDVIVNLPDDKHIIVDSKVSLVAYESYCSSEDSSREQWAKAHVDSLKRHIDGLSKKEYHAAEKLITPDFVILFMAIEPAFALAFRAKPELFQYAWDRNVAIVSPTTLLATLRTVGAIWKQDKQERNAMEIAKRGGLLYDKFAMLMSDLEDIGKKLKAAQDSYEGAINKVSTGPGNLLRQVEQLKELGAKTQKSLPKADLALSKEAPEA